VSVDRRIPPPRDNVPNDQPDQVCHGLVVWAVSSNLKSSAYATVQGLDRISGVDQLPNDLWETEEGNILPPVAFLALDDHRNPLAPGTGFEGFEFFARLLGR
jgi:hypothetical protein